MCAKFQPNPTMSLPQATPKYLGQTDRQNSQKFALAHQINKNPPRDLGEMAHQIQTGIWRVFTLPNRLDEF